jgi:HEAT repeat protein
MAKDASPELAHLITDPNSETWELREAAVIALATVAFEEQPSAQQAPQLKVVVNALYAGLVDPSVKVKLATIQSLNILQYGQDAAFKQNLAAHMQKMTTRDLDPLCKLRAYLTIYTTLEKPADKKKERAFIGNFLDHKEPHVRTEAAQALGLIGEEAKDQVPHLIKSLKDKDLSVVAMTILALAHIKDKSAVPQLQMLADNAEMPEVVRATAKDAVDIVSGLNTKKDESKKGASKK